jgi:hypothetical protein
MRLFKIALLLVSVPLLAAGGEGIYHAARNRQQLTLTCEQFVRQPPRALWIRVTGCDIDYVSAGYRESRGHLAELFFPVRPVKEPPAAPVALIAATRDPQVVAIAENTIGDGRQANQEAFLVMMLRVITMLGISREVEGYARSGAIELAQTRRALAGLSAPLAPRLVVLDLHARPSFLVPGLEAGAGAALVLLALMRRRRSPEPVEQEAAVPPGDVSGEGMSRRLPAIMLLNLPPTADVDAVERAPALGSRAEAIEQIVRHLGWVHVDWNGRGTLSGPDWSLTLDLGSDEQVWTIAIETRGEGSIRPLAALARGAGWRMFMPKRGTFVEAAQLEHVERPRAADAQGV